MQACLAWSGETSEERTMISRCVNWMWRCSRMCVCARWLIGPPLTRHFHYLIAWKGRRGDCRSLAVRAKRMDLECISIGSKAPAVGGCPRPVGPSWKRRWAVPPPASAGPPPHPGVPSVSRLLHWKALRLHWAHTWCDSQSPLSWCLQGTVICHTSCSSQTPLFHFFRSDLGPCSPHISAHGATLVGGAW